MSLGRNPTKLPPGLRLAIPIYHTVQASDQRTFARLYSLTSLLGLQKVDIRETSVNIQDLSAFTSDNVPVVISGSLFYRVRNSYDACFSVGDFQANVKNIGTSAVRSIVGHFTVSTKSKLFQYLTLNKLFTVRRRHRRSK